MSQTHFSFGHDATKSRWRSHAHVQRRLVDDRRAALLATADAFEPFLRIGRATWSRPTSTPRMRNSLQVLRTP
jgi:hypothetical protein